jgi:hypothetical protein
MMQVVARLLPAVARHFRSHAIPDQVPLLALLAAAAGTSQAPAVSRAAFSGKDDDWLTGWRAPDPDADDGSSEAEEGEEAEDAEEEAAIAAFRRIGFNTGVARVATRLLELAPRAVPEIVLYPCPGGRSVDIARVVAATQPGTVRRFALCDFAESEADQADAVEIFKLACATWGPSSLRYLCIKNLARDALRFVQPDVFVATAHCPHLEVLSIPRIVLPPSFVASEATCDSDAATSAVGHDSMRLPSPTVCSFNAPLRPSPHFAPYAATLRSLELSNGPDNAAEFAFIATQLPSLRCFILAAYGGCTGRIPTGVWRRGLRQLLRQLHKLYVFSLSRRLCRALNTLHVLAAADAQRSAALRLTPGAMQTILQSDSDETDGSDDDSSISVEADCKTVAGAVPMEDIPLQVFSIFGLSLRGPYSIAPFMRYLSQHAPPSDGRWAEPHHRRYGGRADHDARPLSRAWPPRHSWTH